ncbi:MAG: VOC family protein [Candidatus Dormiibacterota bacterium]
MGNPVVHFEVIGEDGTALSNFYEGAFGWEMHPATQDPMTYVLVHPGGERGIEGGIGGTSEQDGRHVTFYVEVEDPEATLATIEKLGGRTLMAPDRVPNGPVVAMFADPEGNAIGLIKAEAHSHPHSS